MKITDADIETARNVYIHLHGSTRLGEISDEDLKKGLEMFQALSKLLTISNGPFDKFFKARKEIAGDVKMLQAHVSARDDS